jgi:hypothetical protein
MSVSWSFAAVACVGASALLPEPIAGYRSA